MARIENAVVQSANWGSTSTDSIRWVADEIAFRLSSGSGELIRVTLFPEQDGPGHPLHSWDYHSDGSRVIFVACKDNDWQALVRGYSEEVIHTLLSFEKRRELQQNFNSTNLLWLDEAISKAAMMFILRLLIAEWDLNPPPLDSYSTASLEWERNAQIHVLANSGGESLPDWIVRNATDLARDAHLLYRNRHSFDTLLPIFERNSYSWDALIHLNENILASDTLAQRLEKWQKSAPASYEPFILEVASAFGVQLIPTSVTGRKGCSPFASMVRGETS